MKASRIRYLPNGEIDKAKWDGCVYRSPNGLLYATSLHLDHMAGNQWDGLVLGDYEAVMPLPWRKKYGILYLYQPAFTQQSGIFYMNAITPQLEAAFILEAKRHFAFAEIFLNHAHPAKTQHPETIKTNYVLDLSLSYRDIRAKYHYDFAKNVKRADKNGLRLNAQALFNTAIAEYATLYGKLMPELTSAQYRQFAQLCAAMDASGNLYCRECLDENGERMSSILLLKYKNRYYNLVSNITGKGKALKSNHFLYDAVIRELSGTGHILDLEGSDLPGVAHFYSILGAENQPYYFRKWNDLPYYLRWLKN